MLHISCANRSDSDPFSVGCCYQNLIVNFTCIYIEFIKLVSPISKGDTNFVQLL